MAAVSQSRTTTLVLCALLVVAACGSPTPSASASAEPVASAASVALTPGAQASPSVSLVSPAAPSPSASPAESNGPAPSPSPVPPATPPPSTPPGPSTGPAAAIVPGSVHRTSLAVRATYRVSARLGWSTGRLSGSVTIRATNASGAGIDRLELNTVMAPLGGLRLGTTTVDGRAVTPSVGDQTIRVPLGGVLPDGATAVVVVRFAATLRTATGGSQWLFARANGIADLYRWIPWVSRATPFGRPNYGDPFVTPSSPSVRVVLTSDVPLRWATTGREVAHSGHGLRTEFTAADVRDFAVTASRDATARRAVVNGTVIRVVGRGAFPAARVLAAAVTGFRRLEARLGPYPYGVLTISESAGGYGMEGPMTAWIPPNVASSNLAYLVTHEIAHQWFYGLVGNDQAREPFADEAMADMATRFVLGMRRASACPTARLDLPIYRYTAACYYETVYIQGGNLLDDARRRIGTTAFFAAVRSYLAAHRLGLVHTRTLLDAINAASPVDVASIWRPRFPSLY